MRIKKNMVVCIGISLIFLIMFAGNAVAPTAVPEIDIEKYTLGTDGVWYDADTAPGPDIPVGSTVEWKYVVTNIGGEHVVNVDVIDDQIGPISCPKTELAPGENVTCTATGTAVAGQYENTATVVATDAEGQSDADEDPSHYFGVNASIDIEKHTNGEDADVAPGPSILIGHMVTWTYNVTNTGDVNLTNITVTDSDPAVFISCPKSELAPGEYMECTATGTVVIGQYSNFGNVSAKYGGLEVNDTDASHYIGFGSGGGGGLPYEPPEGVPTVNYFLLVGVLGIAVVLFLRRKQD